MIWLLKRNDGAYVAPAGSWHSYTRDIREARKFASLAEAERERCPENESIVALYDEVNR
jgi:hypothetical protein